ncbi:hypothetical protein EYC84_009783 [Monilinia fructicola]|uniref:PEP5/VPS11 N-terminal domain-containing protein n=1 Tax=Monilinia fructicola TaxID=38448 RepID=A0A5M9JDJ3_MONFR|nr:hypothetical protein EYC84_009783 [Monilinia fructicola]
MMRVYLSSRITKSVAYAPVPRICSANISSTRCRFDHTYETSRRHIVAGHNSYLSHEPVLKVWALDKPVKKTGLPTCQSSLSIQNGRKQFPISAFTAMDDLSQLAVGFGNGAVTVIRGDLIHDRGAKQRTVHESEEPITGLSFREEDRLINLYVATTSRLVKLVISGRGQGQSARPVEDSGCGVGCMTVDKKNSDILVVRDDAIYYYRVDGRNSCYGYDGPKSLVAVYGDYVAIVSPPATSSATKSISQVKDLFIIWGDLFTLTQDGKIHRYHEKPLQQRLETLYQRNLYVHAINLAQKAGMDSRQQNMIFRKSGDFLYQKGDYDGAMQQYLKAIDSTEPSQVIRKYLDTQRIHNLIEYLEELHEHHKATADHTTLLLNCYAKLKDIDKLEKFIKSPGDLKFDLDTAITMCRQGGYYEQAAYLATKHDALKYIWRLDPDSAYPILMKYARVLLEHWCYRPTKDIVITSGAPVQHAGYASGAAGAAGAAVTAVANMRDLIPLPFMNTSTITSPATIGNVNSTPANGQVIEDLEPLPPAYSPPQPRTAFSSFVDHPEEFIVFLEACLKEPGLKERDKIDLYTTLFENIRTERSKLLRKYGPEEPQLYPAALAYFTSDPRILEDAGDELDAVLEKIDADGLMAPLQVIQTLSTNAVATMGMVKTYLQQTIEHTQTKRQEITELSSKPQTFNATRCSFCSTQLDFPPSFPL